MSEETLQTNQTINCEGVEEHGQTNAGGNDNVTAKVQEAAEINLAGSENAVANLAGNDDAVTDLAGNEDAVTDLAGNLDASKGTNQVSEHVH